MPSLVQKLLLFSGGSPAIEITPSSWDFGSTPVGTPVSKEFTIENTGTAPLTITAINLPTGYTLTDPALPITILAGATDTFTVEVDALTGEVFAGNISIVSNAATSPTLVAITVLVAYLLDTFASGVVTSPRTADIGAWTIADTGPNLSLSSGNLQFTNIVAQNDPILYDSSTRTRAKGLTLLARNLLFSQRARFGWTNTTRTVAVAAAENAIQYINDENIAVSLNPVLANVDVAVVLDTAGGYIYARPTGVGDFKLIWRDNQSNLATVRAYIAAVNGSALRSIGEVIMMLDSNDILINPSQNVASPVSAQTYTTGTPSAIIEMTLAVVTMSDASGIKFRVQDANNYWYAYFDAAGAFKVDRYINGSPDGGSPYVNVAAVQANGGTRRIRVVADGTSLKFFTKSAGGAGTWTQRGGTISDLLLGAYSDIIPVAGATYTISNLRSDKLFDAAITALLDSWQ